MKKTMTKKRVLVCNTGRCSKRFKITPELRPLVEISTGGIHSLPVEVTGPCPSCGSKAGAVDLDAGAFAQSLSNMFRF